MCNRPDLTKLATRQAIENKNRDKRDDLWLFTMFCIGIIVGLVLGITISAIIIINNL
jgi:hypothetical protein